MLRILKSMTI
ncbi:unnamed protein product, partial [Allacma fusca]